VGLLCLELGMRAVKEVVQKHSPIIGVGRGRQKMLGGSRDCCLRLDRLGPCDKIVQDGVVVGVVVKIGVWNRHIVRITTFFR
jgi:hypothetical protein